jgi:predicted DNA-binding protein YlxM (UPF0122 family)
MDDELCRSFFRDPTQTLQKHYEILRAYFIDGCSLAELADMYDMSYYTIRDLVRRFRKQCQQGDVPPFFWSPT